MRVVNNVGQCIGCQNNTNIMLDSDVFVCSDCLAVIGKQTYNIHKFFNHLCKKAGLSESSKKDVLDNIIDLLRIMYVNDVFSVDNAIKTLEAIKMSDGIHDLSEIPDLGEENLRKMQEVLDKLQ